MNIELARAIPMPEILNKIGLQPAKKKPNDYWYYSPFRNEKTPSFHVNVSKNVWYDFGEDKGGDTVNFVCAYLKATGSCHTVHDALRWLRNMFDPGISIPPIPKQETAQDESKLSLKSVKPLTHIALIRYLESRGISSCVAQEYLKEIRIYNKDTKKQFFAAAMRNEEGGYDYRNPYFKGCLKPKSITFIRGASLKPDGIHIFEGMMDFLSAIMQHKQKFLEDVIILNSVVRMREAIGYIRGFGYRTAYTWLDNNEAGERTTEAFSKFFETENIRHVAMNARYAPYEDVNEWHKKRLNL